MRFEKLALEVPKILLPKDDVDLYRWAVIACDQYTSEPEYWKDVERLVVDSPSTLNLVFPEVYLEDDNSDSRIKSINANMQRYLETDVLIPHQEGFVLVDRKTSQVPSRKGLIVALDLEAYDYRSGAKTLIRATEGTIVDRLPPRIRVRENAAIELPHIMVLIDDPEMTVIEPLFSESLEMIYDFELMQSGGHLRGWRVDHSKHIEQIVRGLSALAQKERFQTRYGVDDDDVMLYAMGDGNHSFATAKAIWEQIKSKADDAQKVMDHPARYAMVELVNVHDKGLEFEAIHRVLFNVDTEDLLNQAKSYYRDLGTPCRVEKFDVLEEAKSAAHDASATHSLPFVTADGFGLLQIDNPGYTLEVATLQDFLDVYLEKRTESRIDYIHGENAVTRFGRLPGNMGFYLPSISKHNLFRTIVRDGALPRKTFSMGGADEKRFYMEARQITRAGH